ncbi:MAG: carboxymuconolactone decarboxylase family protein [Dehalococcoidia bacterium]|jgi:alkylhydroperoxidase family enzyme|nr:carboxymuconolactone decarboxylase family protein [Dehalococcoidia bacterium]
MARIPYVEKDVAAQEIAELFEKMEANGAPVANIWKILAHVPPTLLHVIRMGNGILTKTRLDPKLREMAILLTAEILDCEYERRAHAMFGRELGMTDEQMKSINNFEGSGAFSDAETAVLRFSSEVAKGGRVKEETFSALAGHMGQDLMVELAQTVGFYGMLGRILLAFEVDLSEEVPTSSSQITGRPKK